MTPPPHLGLSMGLSRSPVAAVGGGGGSLDPQAYIDNLVAEGYTPSAGEQTAINTFFTTGNADGWLAKMAGMWFTAWGDLAANSVSMVDGTKYVATTVSVIDFGSQKGLRSNNTSNGGVDTQLTTSSAGWSISNMHQGYCLSATTSSGTGLGGFIGTKYCATLKSGPTFRFMESTGGISPSSFSSSPTGIITTNVDGTTERMRRYTTGGTDEGLGTTTDAGPLPDSPIHVLRVWNYDTSSAIWSSGTGTYFGGFWVATSLSDAEDASLAAAFRTLYNSVTGYTLP